MSSVAQKIDLDSPDLEWIGIRFIDPLGRVFRRNGTYYRAIYNDKVPFTNALLSEGLIGALADKGRAYVIEANSHIVPPKRYLSRFGQFLENSPFCERDLHGPTALVEVENLEGEVEVLVKHRTSHGIVGTRYVVPTHPFDVVGWDGCLYPYTFSIHDYEPITGRVHQPPPAHQAFEGNNFVICNFVPRKVDYHPLAVPVPYYHSNVDSDEIMFYCGGDYEARKGSGIGQGSISVHPGGHAHGPQPGAYERSIGVEFFDELAVMVDTFHPLKITQAAMDLDDPNYPFTWLSPDDPHEHASELAERGPEAFPD